MKHVYLLLLAIILLVCLSEFTQCSLCGGCLGSIEVEGDSSDDERETTAEQKSSKVEEDKKEESEGEEGALLGNSKETRK
ncbi:hypothetical protein LSTR_LSTR003922 [Laodelphax striatellus]|uniref:Secreted protein n=1 Tax=Laodelphax striatellus TaxID=195883 RepID=A0A482X921_LAOST|nr:hypothetical protein LSTR_LSTR003922 [Laodelphax striatellus]